MRRLPPLLNGSLVGRRRLSQQRRFRSSENLFQIIRPCQWQTASEPHAKGTAGQAEKVQGDVRRWLKKGPSFCYGSLSRGTYGAHRARGLNWGITMPNPFRHVQCPFPDSLSTTAPLSVASVAALYARAIIRGQQAHSFWHWIAAPVATEFRSRQAMPVIPADCLLTRTWA